MIGSAASKDFPMRVLLIIVSWKAEKAETLKNPDIFFPFD